VAAAVAVPDVTISESAPADVAPPADTPAEVLGTSPVGTDALSVVDSVVQSAAPVSEPLITAAVPATDPTRDQDPPASQPVFTAAPDSAESGDELGATLLSWAGFDGQGFGSGPDDPAAMPLAWAGLAMTRRELDNTAAVATPMAVTTSGEPAQTPEAVGATASALPSAADLAATASAPGKIFPYWTPGEKLSEIEYTIKQITDRAQGIILKYIILRENWTPGEKLDEIATKVESVVQDIKVDLEDIVEYIQDKIATTKATIKTVTQDIKKLVSVDARIQWIERQITIFKQGNQTKINNFATLIATLKEVDKQFVYLKGVLAPYAGDYGILKNYLQETVEDAVRDVIVVVKTVQTEGLGTVVKDILQNGYTWTLPVIEIPVNFELPSSSFSGDVIPIAGDLLSFAGTTSSTNPKKAPFGLAINSWSGPTDTYLSIPEFTVNVGSSTTVIYLTPSITFNWNSLRAVFLRGDLNLGPTGPDPDPVDPGVETDGETGAPVEVPKIQFGLAVSGMLPVTASISGPTEWGTCSAYSGSGACTAAGGDISLNNVEFTYHAYGCESDCTIYDGYFGGNNVDYFTIPSVTLENVPTDTAYSGPSLTIGGTETWLTMNWSPNTVRSQYSDAGFSLIPDIPFTLNLGSFVLEPEGFAIDSLYLQLQNVWCVDQGISGCQNTTQATINGISNTTGLGIGPVIISGNIGGSLYDYPESGGLYYTPVVKPTIDISAANGELTATIDTVHSLDINIPIEATLSDIYLGSGQNFLNGNNPDSASDLFYIMFPGGSPAGSDSVTVEGYPFNMSDLYIGPGNLGCYQGDSTVCSNILVPEQSLSGVIGNGFAFVTGWFVRGYNPKQSLADVVVASTTVSLSAAGLSVSTSGSLPDYLLVAGGVNGGSFLVNQINTNQVKINTCLDSDPDACLESVNIYLGAYALGGSSTSTSASTEDTSDFETDDNYLVLPYGNADQAAILGGEVPDQSLGLGTTANWIQLGSLESTGLPTVATVSSSVPFTTSISAGAAGVGYSATIGTTEDPVQAAWSLGQLSLLTSYLLSQYNISVGGAGGGIIDETKSQSATAASVPGVTITNGVSGTSEGVVAIGSSNAAAASR
jgi:hypothetical protein